LTARVLASRRDIAKARSSLRRRGLDARTPLLHNLLHALGLRRAARVGDRHKSWDLLLTLDFIARHLPPSAPILDLGAYASELLPALHRLGYSQLCGIDLDPRVAAMPHAERIAYRHGNFLDLPAPAMGYAAITAISVLEHGLSVERLLAMANRTLAPGGYFIASVDYWPEKVDTTGVRLFGLDWCIFSRSELEHFFALASELGLHLVGEVDLDATVPTIRWAKRRYTFAWWVLQRAPA
jgi:SAM-dependent methyltransferase